MKIKYIDNKQERGIQYEWKKIRAEYNKLNVPHEYYYPCFSQIENGVKIIQSISKRSTGKTTAWLLMGMCVNKLYEGVTIQYVRTTEDELTPLFANKLTEVIRTYENARYIRQITDGEYNDIIYHWRQFFYCYRDAETGEITKKSESPIIQCLCVSKEEDYKSSYNTFMSRGDIVLYDEFISSTYYPNSFFHFFNLFKTIQRERRSPIIIMSANNTNLHSIWFAEFGIQKEVRDMRAGDSKLITTEKGTRIYVEFFAMASEQAKKNRDEVNKLYFGFNNPKLSSITGENDWAFDFYPHIPPENKEENLICYIGNLYIYFNLEFVRVKICVDDIRGLHARIHVATKIYDDSVVLSLDMAVIQKDSRYQYGFGYSKKLKNLFNKLIEQKRLYFSTNEVGALFYEYLRQYKISR